MLKCVEVIYYVIICPKRSDQSVKMISTNIKYVHKNCSRLAEVPEILFWFCFLIRDVANEDGVLGDVVGRILMLVHVRAGDCLSNI